MSSMEKFWERYELLYEKPSAEVLGCKERLNGVNFKPGDVVIVGSPKTGTTWLQQILHQIRTKGDEDFADIYTETKFIPYYFMGAIEGYDVNEPQKAKPRVFKSHDQYKWIQHDPTVKVPD